MANPRIIPKKSVQAGRVPLTTDLEGGEICINHTDKKLYAKNPSTGAIQEIGGGIGEHSHDELYSSDSSKHLELQNNGDLVLNTGASTITMTPVKSGQIVVGSTADSTPVNSVRCMTQGEYDALGTYDPNTLYFIK